MTYADTIKEGIEMVNEMEWTNGMATLPVSVEKDTFYLKIIRKCGNLDRPEILLFKVVPKNEVEPCILEKEIHNTSEEILENMGLYGDLDLQFKNGKGAIKTAIIKNL